MTIDNTNNAMNSIGLGSEYEKHGSLGGNVQTSNVRSQEMNRYKNEIELLK